MEYTAFERLEAGKQDAILAAGIAEFAAYAYHDANTDRITAACGISKGLLYHYFGTKQGFYLYCLQKSLDTLTACEPPAEKEDFYAVLWESMERKMRLCAEHPDKMHFVNLASRESAAEVKDALRPLLAQYAARMQLFSQEALRTAIRLLPLRVPPERAAQGLILFCGAVISRYLMRYQEQPDQFFGKKDEIRREIKEDIDLMLYGICKGESA